MATIRKYSYQDLEFIAALLEGEYITPERLSQVVKDAKVMGELILKKVDEEYNKSLKKAVERLNGKVEV